MQIKVNQKLKETKKLVEKYKIDSKLECAMVVRKNFN
jgi:hypothetical protein